MTNVAQLKCVKGRAETIPAQSTAVTKSLYVSRLLLTDFRSYTQMSLEAGPRSVVLTGPNGAGKTNILEALSFLSSGRGLRSAKLSEVSRMGSAGNWAVAAKLETPDGLRELGSGIVAGLSDGQRQGEEELSLSAQKDRRIARIDGQTVSGPAAFEEFVQVAWLTPQMDRLFIEAASGRRRFLDRIVANFHGPHSREVNAYERVMRERNRLLAEGQFDPSWVSSLEGRMAEHGVAVAAARLEALSLLEGAMAEGGDAFPRAALSVEGDLETDLLLRPAIAVEERFRALLADNRGQDRVRGRATLGPHKTDLLVRHVAKNMPAGLCSTGEQKALLIGITLASARIATNHFGAAPILLLDEVAAHLDEVRRRALFDELEVLGSQVWLTGTDRLLFEGLEGRAHYFSVEDGRVVEN